jgi:HD-GYP domain-containing protein (c-di-GMP phosphodiesterase class II)
MTSRGLPLSISVGYAIGAENKNNTISDLFREADDNMYREKLKNSQSARQALFQSIMQNADEKDFRLGGHSDRIKILAEKLANSIGLPLARITALRRLAQYHAIGTVGIPEQILFKPGPLTHQERVKMQRHSDIGRRIAQSIPDLSTIADLIWKHHEWWDGNGYPLGLEGDEIPIECRILAIVEAYDAMTHNRPYRTAMTVDKAKAELVRCAGSQFDPELTQRFLELLEEQLNTVGAAG